MSNFPPASSKAAAGAPARMPDCTTTSFMLLSKSDSLARKSAVQASSNCPDGWPACCSTGQGQPWCSITCCKPLEMHLRMCTCQSAVSTSPQSRVCLGLDCHACRQSLQLHPLQGKRHMQDISGRQQSLQQSDCAQGMDRCTCGSRVCSKASLSCM